MRQYHSAFRGLGLIQLSGLLLLFGFRAGTGIAVAANVALGRQYEWSTPPRYGQCQDDGDATQLTDGISADANWTVPSTVGWVHQGRVTVTIDLGSVLPIGRVAFVASGGGHADVFFPALTAVLTGDDGQTWYLGGAVGSGGLVQDRSKWYAHRFETDALQTHGRYVRLVFQAEERYLFVDEIEVESGAEEATRPARGAPVSEDVLEALLRRGLRARWVAGEWPEFRAQVAGLAAAEGAATPAISGRLQDIDTAVLQTDVTDSDAVERLRRRYTHLRADVARGPYGDGVRVRRMYPWAEYRGETFPPALDALPPEIQLLLWQGEYDAVAWTATNLGAAAARVRISVGPLHDEQGTAYPRRQRLQLRQGMAIPTRVGYRVLDALPLLSADDRNAAEVGIDAGEYRLLWLTVCARGLPAGTYTADIRIEALPSGELLLRSPLTLTVAALRMPPADERALAAYVWEELIESWPEPAAAVADLRAHGINTFMLHPRELPRPQFDEGRRRLVSVDFGPMDAALALRGQPRMHGIFWGGPFSCWGLDLEDAEDAELFKQFIQAWGEHLAQTGFQPDDFFFYPLDEETSERMLRLAQLIKEADPRFQVYWNRVINPDVDTELMRRLAPSIDIACPNIFTLADYADTRRQETVFRELRQEYPFQAWTYACSGPGRLKAPDTYYRNLSWETFRMGATGTGFWCYGYGNLWDAYEGGLHYGVAYSVKNAPPGVTRAEPIIPSRRWEAFREGTEDFEYLHQLQRAIAEAGEAGVAAPERARAATLLKDTVDNVLTTPDDSSRYDRGRRAFTGAILDLRRRISAAGGG